MRDESIAVGSDPFAMEATRLGSRDRQEVPIDSDAGRSSGDFAKRTIVLFETNRHDLMHRRYVTMPAERGQATPRGYVLATYVFHVK